MKRKIIMCLGRNGDIISILPMLLNLSQTGVRPILCVAETFEGVLDGVSYADRIVYPGSYNEPEKGHRWLQNHFRGEEIVIAQHYRHPFDRARRTSSYQTESWRVAGQLDQFGRHPLVFDRRDSAREATFSALPATEGMDHILVAMNGVSSPFLKGAEVMAMLVESFPMAVIWDISSLRAERIFDLISVYEKSVCLVSVDTVHLHLARAAKVPVVALINDGFFGSVPPPGSVATIRYSDPNLVEGVRQAVHAVLDAKNGHYFVVHAVHAHGDSERHQRARATWESASVGESVIKYHSVEWGFNATEIGDKRDLPPIKTVLQHAREKCLASSDVILFHNSDVGLTPGSMAVMRRHAATFGAFSMRRKEPGSDYIHIGRELFGFSAEWFDQHFAEIPDFFLGSPYFDLVIAALIRKHRGIVSTKANLAIDFYPCEIEAGMATHEAHASNWDGDNEFKLPANLWNRRLALEWCKNNMPSLAP